MNSIYSHSELFLKIAEMGYWFDKRQIELWAFDKEWKRHRRTEILLRRLSTRKKKGLLAVRYGNKLVYRLRKGSEEVSYKNIYHGLNCMECLLRFYKADTDCELVPEKHFRGCGSVPDGGIRYPNGTILCFEFSTLDNVIYHDQIPAKLKAYERSIDKIEEKFKAKAIVVFILDVPRDRVRRYVGSSDGMSAHSASLRAGGDRFPVLPFCFFTDYETFKNVPIGEQLTAPIYFWKDGKEYTIKK